MKSRLFTSALFNPRNIAALLLAVGTAVLVSYPTAFSKMFQFVPIDGAALISIPASIAVYLAFVLQSFFSKDFQDGFLRRDKIKQIKELNRMCFYLANEAKRYTNSTYSQKLRKIVSDREDIVESFFRGEHSYLKERIVEQSLTLVVAYLKLLINFCIRSRELSEMSLGNITERINVNLRKLNFTKDSHAAEDIRNVINMDEKIIERMKDEKKELERISAKLDFMESTVNMFKHQTISSIESEDLLEKLGTAVNEAIALDNVLDERRKGRMKY
jgi:hypothetical protein